MHRYLWPMVVESDALFVSFLACSCPGRYVSSSVRGFNHHGCLIVVYLLQTERWLFSSSLCIVSLWFGTLEPRFEWEKFTMTVHVELTPRCACVWWLFSYAQQSAEDQVRILITSPKVFFILVFTCTGMYDVNRGLGTAAGDLGVAFPLYLWIRGDFGRSSRWVNTVSNWARTLESAKALGSADLTLLNRFGWFTSGQSLRTLFCSLKARML